MVSQMDLMRAHLALDEAIRREVEREQVKDLKFTKALMRQLANRDDER